MIIWSTSCWNILCELALFLEPSAFRVVRLRVPWVVKRPQAFESLAGGSDDSWSWAPSEPPTADLWASSNNSRSYSRKAVHEAECFSTQLVWGNRFAGWEHFGAIQLHNDLPSVPWDLITSLASNSSGFRPRLDFGFAEDAEAAEVAEH